MFVPNNLSNFKAYLYTHAFSRILKPLKSCSHFSPYISQIVPLLPSSSNPQTTLNKECFVRRKHKQKPAKKWHSRRNSFSRWSLRSLWPQKLLWMLNTMIDLVPLLKKSYLKLLGTLLCMIPKCLLVFSECSSTIASSGYVHLLSYDRS